MPERANALNENPSPGKVHVVESREMGRASPLSTLVMEVCGAGKVAWITVT